MKDIKGRNDKPIIADLESLMKGYKKNYEARLQQIIKVLGMADKLEPDDSYKITKIFECISMLILKDNKLYSGKPWSEDERKLIMKDLDELIGELASTEYSEKAIAPIFKSLMNAQPKADTRTVWGTKVPPYKPHICT